MNGKIGKQFGSLCLTLCLAAGLLAGCGNSETEQDGLSSSSEDSVSAEPEQEAEEAAEQTEEAAEEVSLDEKVAAKLASLTLEEKVAQMFIITPEALTGVETAVQAGSQTQACLEEYPVGGIIYMADNLIDTDQTVQMLENTMEYSQEAVGLPIFLSVDEEGGTVARVASNSAFGVTDVGNMSEIGTSGETQAAY